VNGRFLAILNITEKNVYFNESPSLYAWTAIPDGTAQRNNKTCNSWQNNDQETQGHYSRVFNSSPWSKYISFECDEVHPFYCVED